MFLALIVGMPSNISTRFIRVPRCAKLLGNDIGKQISSIHSYEVMQNLIFTRHPTKCFDMILPTSIPSSTLGTIEERIFSVIKLAKLVFQNLSTRVQTDYNFKDKGSSTYLSVYPFSIIYSKATKRNLIHLVRLQRLASNKDLVLYATGLLPSGAPYSLYKYMEGKKKTNKEN